jgi:hypothetical protein
MVNIDEIDDYSQCVAYLIPHNKSFPGSVAYISSLKSHEAKQTAKAYVSPVDPRTGFQSTWEEVKEFFSKDIAHSKEGDVSIEIEGDTLSLSANTDIGVKVEATLSKPTDSPESKIVGDKVSWQEFKQQISAISKTRFLFRGQRERWRLRTAFHRAGRYRISEFTKRDVKLLHNRLSSITSHYFDLSIPEQNGAFFNLIQHHGYPTPLLDWSYSPYVAAFFAFRDWPNALENGEDYARIYIFDRDSWVVRYPQIQNLDPAYPHLSVMEFIAINNPRLVPQQSVTTVTNIDDIEAYLLEKELESDTKYLHAYDIPASEREVAMRELRFMGITAGSMFPSIDGICEELKEQNFEI